MTILRLELKGPTDRDAVEADVVLAMFASECVFGRPRVRLEASYLVAEDGRACVVRADGHAGDAAARIFAGLTAVRLGEDAYKVQRLAAERHDD